MDDLTLFAVGLFFGWQWATWWCEQPRAVTWEHEVGATLAQSMKSIMDQRRFVGSGMVIEKRWTTQTKMGEFEVVLIRRDCEQMADL